MNVKQESILLINGNQSIDKALHAPLSGTPLRIVQVCLLMLINVRGGYFIQIFFICEIPTIFIFIFLSLKGGKGRDEGRLNPNLLSISVQAFIFDMEVD